MRILHVIGTLAEEFGGPVAAVQGMARSLARLGHEVTLFTTDAGFHRRLPVPLGREVLQDGYRTVYHRALFVAPPYVSPALTRALFRDRRWDVVHVHGLFTYSTTSSMILCRALGIPLVASPCGSLMSRSWRKRALLALAERSNLAAAGRVHFTTETERRDSQRWGIPMRAEVIPIGVDLPDGPAVPAEPSPIGPGRPYLLFLGRLHPRKGFDILIPAFARVAARRPGLDLVLAGPDTDGFRKDIEGLCERHGVRGRVRLVGHASGAEKARILAGCSAFVLASLHSENFGVAVLEAAAAGAPLVVSRSVGLAEDVVESGAGRSADLDPASFAEAIESVLESDRLELARRSRALAARFAWGSVAGRIETMYHAILAEVRSSHP